MTVICTAPHRTEHRVRRHGFALGLLDGLRLLAAMPGQWRQRAAELRHLRSLEDHTLADMGLTRAEVERETHSPFWRPIGWKRYVREQVLPDWHRS